ncbi:MAG: glutamine synthetase III [Desulfovibrio sp.]|nr:glutamine synthetase III [Desulfovibrio sp.]
MSTVPEMFASKVFDDKVMRTRLPEKTYNSLRRTIDSGSVLDQALANTIAKAMCDWAVENGATHFTHWFQPLTGITAEKHDSFINTAPDGRVIMELTGKELIKGEPDASSFPSGGLRATFEARGYTAWDPSSYAFIKGKTLCIPTAFCSYGGEALDKKTPLLRSMEALNRQALRILKLFGNTDVRRVTTNVGPEQEYFLVDREMYLKRKDLIYTGRTLFGAKPPKGQELEDHYFGAIKPRVQAYMEELNEELWKLGILAKTEHNEVAPAQHELAPIYATTNVATDHNQLTMEIMKKVARKHGLVCLLHEKPFAGVNGSGKHNNWSISDSEGNNLLNPGATPQDNAQFLVFLAAVLRAVHRHAPALRLGTVGAGNDHRLGANEAPPAILSVYLGDQLAGVLDALVSGGHAADSKSAVMEIGVSTLPPLPVDLSDRNRTSPFAFTGNKFEFRAVGSSQSVAPVNIALNAAVACALDDIATELEASTAAGTPLNTALQKLLPRLFKEHMPVVFNGNGYAASWQDEAARRGLPNDKDTVAALERYSEPAVMDVFLRCNILTEREMLSRQEILLENYAKTLCIEGRVMADMLRASVLPAGREAQRRAADTLLRTREALRGEPAGAEEEYFADLRAHLSALASGASALEAAVASVSATEGGALAKARSARDGILPAMKTCREHADALERMVDDSLWPLPKYAELLWTN